MSRKTSKSMRLSEDLQLNGNIWEIDRCDQGFEGRLKYLHMKWQYQCCYIEWWWWERAVMGVGDEDSLGKEGDKGRDGRV